MRYFLRLSYDGTSYHGWQRQPNVLSVQESIETALEKVLKRPVSLIGCGRTDAGVHASGYIAHIDIADSLPDSFLSKINYALPEDIAIHKAWEVERGLHAQYSAINRTYHYHLHTQKDPFIRHHSTFLPKRVEALDLNAMRDAASFLLEHTEYRGCCKVPEKHDNTICRISEARFVRQGEYDLCFQITGNRFLRGMVRLLVAQLINIGTGKDKVVDFKARLQAGERPVHFVYAPVQGLRLFEVQYPDNTTGVN